MHAESSRLVRGTITTLVLAALLAAAGLAAIPAAAIVGGLIFVALGTVLAYDVRGLGNRWIVWKRDIGGATLMLSAWLERTLDGAAVAWLGIAVAWAGGLSLH
jgi:hypothetical protein